MIVPARGTANESIQVPQFWQHISYLFHDPGSLKSMSCHCTQQQPVHINQTCTSFKPTCFKQPLAALTVTHSLADTVACGWSCFSRCGWSFFGAPGACSSSDRKGLPNPGYLIFRATSEQFETSPACSSALPAMGDKEGTLLQAQPAPVPWPCRELPAHSPPCKHPC